MTQSRVVSRRSTVAAHPPTTTLVARSFAYWLAQYRRTWRGTAFSTVLEPIGFLVAMGIGLGALVDQGNGSTSLPNVGYLEFVAPGLLAAVTMQAAAFEGSFPVLGAIKWNKQYHAMLATPLRTVDVLAGHLLFVALRLLITAVAFCVVMVLVGAIDAPAALLDLPVALLTGLAYATPIFAFAASIEDHSKFAMLFRFGIIPMFLFSGTFFPIEQLPDWLERLAWVVPLWHGVDLSRDIALGHASLPMALVHVGYLLLWLAAGFLVAWRQFTRRLVN